MMDEKGAMNQSSKYFLPVFVMSALLINVLVYHDIYRTDKTLFFVIFSIPAILLTSYLIYKFDDLKIVKKILDDEKNKRGYLGRFYVEHNLMPQLKALVVFIPQVLIILIFSIIDYMEIFDIIQMLLTTGIASVFVYSCGFIRGLSIGEKSILKDPKIQITVAIMIVFIVIIISLFTYLSWGYIENLGQGNINEYHSGLYLAGYVIFYLIMGFVAYSKNVSETFDPTGDLTITDLSEKGWKKTLLEIENLKGEIRASLPFIDGTTFDALNEISSNNKIKIITSEKGIKQEFNRQEFNDKITKLEDKFNSIELITLSKETNEKHNPPIFHDRFFIAENRLMILGTDLKHSSITNKISIPFLINTIHFGNQLRIIMNIFDKYFENGEHYLKNKINNKIIKYTLNDILNNNNFWDKEKSSTGVQKEEIRFGRNKFKKLGEIKLEGENIRMPHKELGDIQNQKFHRYGLGPFCQYNIDDQSDIPKESGYLIFVCLLNDKKYMKFFKDMRGGFKEYRKIESTNCVLVEDDGELNNYNMEKCFLNNKIFELIYKEKKPYLYYFIGDQDETMENLKGSLPWNKELKI